MIKTSLCCLIIAFGTVAVAAIDASSVEAATKQDDRPNVILCMADDLGWGDTGYNGHPHIKTPNLDQMAKAGARLDRFYVGSPLCVPSRAGFLTGRIAARCGISNHRGSVDYLRAEELTIAELLKTQGYTTGHFGKWHLGMLTEDYRGDKTVLMTPGMAGFDEWFSTPSSVSTHNPYTDPGGIGRGLGGNGSSPPRVVDPRAVFVNNGKPLSEPIKGCTAEIVMDRAIPFIREAVAKQQPFLAVIWFNPPHTPIVGHPKYMSELYSHLSEHQQHYYSIVTALDAQMGRLRQELRDLGIATDTLLAFTSDNGPGPPVSHHNGPKNRLQGSAGPFRERKASLYEGGIREPGLVEWPGEIEPGIVLKAPCTTLDYMPTLAALLDLQLPDRPYDGIDIMPILKGERQDRGGSIGFYFRNAVALSGERYKLIASKQSKGKRRGGRVQFTGKKFELYDLISDPGETTDVADKHPGIVNAMKADLRRWVDSLEPSRLGEDYGSSGTGSFSAPGVLSGKDKAVGGIPEGAQIRLIPLASPLKAQDKCGQWMHPEYTAEDILEMIEGLKPQVLERYFTGAQDMRKYVPVRKGNPRMTVREFLNASLDAGAPGCIIIPKLNLTWITWGREDYFWEAAEDNYGLPLKRPIRIINLDNWRKFLENYGEERAIDLLQRLKRIGYELIGVNMAGGYNEGYGYLSFADFLINSQTWEIRLSTLEKMKTDRHIKQYYLYIDYPGQMDEFMKLSGDQQADVFTEVIQSAERREGFTFVYPVLFDQWDSTKHFTSKGGSYSGDSLYEVIQQSINPSQGKGVLKKRAFVTSKAQEKEGLHLFILSGQSNMKNMDPDVSFTPTIKRAFPDDEVIVTKVAYGGRPISRWVPRAKIYTELLERVEEDTAGKEISTVTFVWMQGERDHQEDVTTQMYKTNLETLYQQLTEDLHRDDINWVIGRLSDARVGTPNWDAIREIQVDVAEKHSRAAWIDTDDLNGPENGVHCPPEGYEEMGNRFANRAIALIQQAGNPKEEQ